MLGTWSREVDNQIGTNSVSKTKTRNSSIRRGVAYHKRVYRDLEKWCKKHAPEQKLYVEPWLRHDTSRLLRQPDAVLVDPLTNSGIVIEVKLNWKDGRDEMLIGTYLSAAQSAFGLVATFPVLITSNVMYLGREPLLGLDKLLEAADWFPGDPTPVILHP